MFDKDIEKIINYYRNTSMSLLQCIRIIKPDINPKSIARVFKES